MDTNTTEYPVDVEHARLAFDRGVTMIAAVNAVYGEFFKARRDASRALWERLRENERIRMMNSMARREYDYTPRTVHRPGDRILDQLKEWEWNFKRLKALADRALSLTLTRAEIHWMYKAETTDFMGEAQAEVERIKANPLPELPDLVERVERKPIVPFIPEERPRSPSIWDSIFPGRS